MSEPVFVHEVPFPLFQRGMFLVFGLVPTILAPYELWRGIWPPNILTPFFGLLVFVAVSLGVTMIRRAVFGASAVLEFRRNQLTVIERTPFGQTTSRFEVADIADIRVVRIESSEGPDEWAVDIVPHNGRKLASRHFGSEERALREAADFRSALYGTA